MWLPPSLSHPTCYLQDRDEIADDVIIAISPGTPKPLCESPRSVGNIITVPSGINPRAAVASVKVFFRVITASIQPHFALSHAQALGILHYHECYIAPMLGNLPTFQLDATVRGAFTPDSTLEFLPTFDSGKCIKRRYLVIFSTHCSGLTLRNPLGAFRHKQDLHRCKHNLEIFDNAGMRYVHQIHDQLVVGGRVVLAVNLRVAGQTRLCL